VNLSILNPFRFLARRRVEYSLRAYEQSPGVEETAAVVRDLLRCRDYNRAFQYADNGYQRFPSSSELLELRQTTLKEMSKHECRELTRKLSRHPAPEIAAKVIEISRSLGDFAGCDRLARRWTSRFPESWILQFSVGKYLFQRSLVDKDPRLSSRCLEQLELAARLNPKSYKTLLYLATLLYQVGSIPRALDCVEALLKHHPKDPKAQALWECIRTAPTRTGAQDAAGASLADLELLRDLEASEAVYGYLVYERRGKGIGVVASRLADDSDFDFRDADSTFSDLIHSFQLASNRMGVGELKTFILEGGSWKVYYRNHPYRSLLVCCARQFGEAEFEKVASTVAPEGVMA
jgi:tetratricopeptide (TPR) repeat protein